MSEIGKVWSRTEQHGMEFLGRPRPTLNCHAIEGRRNTLSEYEIEIEFFQEKKKETLTMGILEIKDRGKIHFLATR
ncbi:hypothetical protein TNCV_859761 [Trichonephila clavipes]|nr:hypothetical protein TNCV_859761 [Trichonephila clavipes]